MNARLTSTIEALERIFVAGVSRTRGSRFPDPDQITIPRTRSCGDACDERAIRFAPQPGAVAPPHVSFELCTGCGLCLDVCPAKAIGMYLPDAAAAV